MQNLTNNEPKKERERNTKRSKKKEKETINK
jgi:hypothetical protein